MAGFVLSSVLHQPSLEAAVIHRVASRLGHAGVPADIIEQTFLEAVDDDRAHSARPSGPISRRSWTAIRP